MKMIEVETHSKEEFLDITLIVQSELNKAAVQEGLCVVYVPHTTAGVTINENADPSVREDLLMVLRKLVPDSLPYQHGEGNAPAHVKASLVGSSVTVLVVRGRLALGTWQGIYLCEFDGPRRRRVYLKLLTS